MKDSPLLRLFLLLVFVSSLPFLFSSCSKTSKDSVMLLDFEDPYKLSGLVWQCKVDYKINMLHATHGLYCLEVDFYPSRQPEFKTGAFNDLFHDWHGYKWLLLDIFNPQDRAIRLFFTIDDHDHNYPWIDKANGNILLHPGINHVKIYLLRLNSPGALTRLNLDYVASIAFFLKHPKRKVVLFFDNIRIKR